MPSVTPPDPGHENDTTTPLGAAHEYDAIDMGGGRCVFAVPRGQGRLEVLRDRWIVALDDGFALTLDAYEKLRRGSRIPGPANTFACDGAAYVLRAGDGVAVAEPVA